MKIYFYGAARTVTGSQFVVEANGRKILVDCGVYQGRRRDFYERNSRFPFEPGEIDAVILTHAHIDHSGNLPNLVKQGYRGPIYATPPTAELAAIMLADSGHIYEDDAQFLNKKKRKHGEPMVEPLYTKVDAENVVPLFEERGYDQPFEPVKGMSASMVDAGHILGSAAVVLDIDEKGIKKRVWFSGDIGRYKLPLLRDPVLPQNPDILVMESTYGDLSHDDPELAYEKFRDIVKRTISRGGNVVVPAFSVGRTQEIVYSLNRMIREGELPAMPVYVDSPLAINATEIFRKFPEYFDDETHEFMSSGQHPALTFPGLSYTRSVEASKAINASKTPSVIISASGMCEAGRILHHLIHNIEDERNTICIVSWQAPNTLGRRLAERQPKVRIFGDEVSVRADIAIVNGLSAHAGQDLLIKYAEHAVTEKLMDIYLVHGDEDAATALKENLSIKGIRNVHYPERMTVVEY
jgi:metallo-beta-lactamase family protein